MNKVFISMIMVIVLLSCKKDNDNSDTLSYLPDEVYPVYSSILYPLSSINIVVNKTDTSLNCSSFLLKNIDTVGVNSDIIEQCIALNKSDFLLAEDKLLSGGLKLVSLDEIYNSETSNEIYEKYGATGMFRFGKPVFFNNGNSAMFEVNHFCGPLCGNGSIIIAKKNNDTWGVEYNFTTWISK